jgi:hypothetical protein
MAQENPLCNTGRPKAATETSLIQRRPENAIVLLLEMQPEIVASSRTQPEAQLRRVASVLTRCARELDIPVLASVVPLAPGVAPELIEELSACKAVPRTTEQAALRQMEAAGVTLSSVPSFLSALISDLSSTDGRIVMNALAAFWS